MGLLETLNKPVPVQNKQSMFNETAKYKLSEKEAWYESQLWNNKNPYALFETDENLQREINNLGIRAYELEKNNDLSSMEKVEAIFENAKETYLLERQLHIIFELGGGLDPYGDSEL